MFIADFLPWVLDKWFVTLLIALVFQTIMFVLARVLRRDDLVDVGWGLGFVVVCFSWLVILPQVSFSYALILFCVSLWGIRLTYHIGLRFFAKNKEDRRYVEMKEGWKYLKIRSYFQIFALQGLLLSIIILPVSVQANIFVTAWWPLVSIGFFVWCLGFYYQVRGDFQLGGFIKENKGGMMRQGLWAKTRHPNYFGEMTMWWGIFLMTLTSFNPLFILITAVGPVTISLLLRYVSGVPMLEKHWEEKYGDEFQKYKEEVPMLVPHITTIFKNHAVERPTK